MLCYQSSRSASDVIHDTFSWLTDNIRAMRPVLWALFVVCVVCAAVGSFQVNDILGKDTFPIDSIFAQIAWPLGSNAGYAGVYTLLSAVTVFMMVPLVARYFDEHRSLKGMTRASLVATMRHYLSRALATTALAALWTYLSVGYSFWISLVTTAAFVVVAPMVIMGRTKGMNLQDKWPQIIKSMLSLMLLYMIISSIPMLCFDVVYIVIGLLQKQVIGLSADMMVGSQWLDLLLALMLYFSFCLADMMMVVGSVLLHGICFDIYD